MGGLGDNQPDEKFDPEQLNKGMGVELEHTKNPEEAKEIVKDHLQESKDFKDNKDENFAKVVKKLTTLNKKYNPYVQVSFLFDKESLLGYKDSPLDKGKEAFEYLFKNRIIL